MVCGIQDGVDEEDQIEAMAEAPQTLQALLYLAKEAYKSIRIVYPVRLMLPASHE